MMKRQLRTRPTQRNDESASLLGDGRLSESKGQKRLRQHPEQTEPQTMTLKTSNEDDFLCQGEPDQNQYEAERKKRKDAEEEGADPFNIQQGVCKDAAQQHEENDMENDKSGESCGQNAHGSVDSIPTEEKRYKCCQCSQIFSNTSDLMVHERTHVAEKVYKCSHCGKRETVRTGQTARKCSHCGTMFEWVPQAKTRGYSCMECDKSYTSRSALLKHLRLHRGERPYQCCFCPEAYTNWWELKTHLQTHRGDTSHEPYKCAHCGMIFLWNPQFLPCDSSHTEMCCYCGRSFTQNSELVEHKKTHTEEEPLACFICGENFDVSSELIAHVQSHKENPDQCSFCGEAFKNSL